MELDDLKNIWQKGDRFKPRREEEFTGMLKGKSHSIIARLKRNIWFELVFTIVGSMLLLYYAFSIPSLSLRWGFIFVLLSFCLYIIYYVKKINLLNRFEGSEGNIRTNLENLVRDLDAFLRFYYRSYTLLYPAYLVLIVIVAIVDRGLEQFLTSMRDWRIITLLLFLVLLSIALSLWVSKWFLGKLYGSHLQKLRLLLKDLQEGHEDSAPNR